MRNPLLLLLVVLLFCFVSANAQMPDEPIQKKVGLGVKVGAGSILGDDLSKTDQSIGPVTSLEGHYNLAGTVEAILEFAYGYNDVNFRLGNAEVTRIYQRSATIGFRFYLQKFKMGNILPTFSAGAGIYQWYYTNNDAPLNLSKDGIQTYKGEEMDFNSLGINAGLGFRYQVSEKFALDGIARFHFIQSKDNTGKFGEDDDHDMNIDFGIGFVYLFPINR
ncbi:MAG: hypothetical protein Kow0037_12470 [Calditrichia bacterium]